MNKTTLYFLIVTVLTTIVTISIFSISSSVLMYSEGMGTFYWDRHIFCEQISQNGVGETMRTFFLQFFAIPRIGVAVMTVGALLLVIAAIAITRLFTKKAEALLLASLPAFCYAFGMLAFLSPIGLQVLTARFTESGKPNNDYVCLSILAREREWTGIIEKCEQDGTVTNLLSQNFLNMSLAEEGLLGDRLFDNPCRDIRSIYNDVLLNEDFAVLLSDIYFSMGHVAQSQRYAFELNEKKNNISPRMLQRLVQTNIIYGHYRVAEKYLLWLKKTLFYKEWAEKQEKFLFNDVAVEKDPEYGMKRKALIADNRFSGIKGLDDDLLNIARQTRGSRQCSTTLQYLGSLYLLARYDQQFISLCCEFPEYKLTEQKYFGEAYKKLRGATITEEQ